MTKESESCLPRSKLFLKSRHFHSGNGLRKFCDDAEVGVLIVMVVLLSTLWLMGLEMINPEIASRDIDNTSQNIVQYHIQANACALTIPYNQLNK